MSEPGRLLDNPFYVLGLAPDCSRAEIERAGQKLLAMLELDLAGAREYPTPFGRGRRDPSKVRAAMAELRDPQRRLLHELWAIGASPSPGDLASSGAPTSEHEQHATRGFSAALPALGWR